MILAMPSPDGRLAVLLYIVFVPVLYYMGFRNGRHALAATRGPTFKPKRQHDGQTAPRCSPSHCTHTAQAPGPSSVVPGSIVASSEEPLHVFTVACERKLYAANALALARSLYEHSPRDRLLHLHILHDGSNEIATYLVEPLTRMTHYIDGNHVRLFFHVLHVPEQMKTQFKVCATARLMVARAFPTLASAVYIDSDAYVTGNLFDLADLMQHWTATQWMGMAQESEDFSGYYARKDKAWSWRPQGLNSGVFVTNLTRWRQRKFTEYALSYDWDKQPSHLGDQDLFNLYFQQHRSEMALLPCNWNIRTDSHCNLNSTARGVYHGNRARFWTGGSGLWASLRMWMGHPYG